MKKYGKDFPKKSKSIEFYPPENYSSAEIDYIHWRRTNKKLTISLIVQLASKGYIRIDEIENNKKKEIQITNWIIKPIKQKQYDDLVSDRVIKVKKLKLVDSTILNKKELPMMTYLFKTGDENKEYGETIIAKVKGFKNFLETVEKDKLGSLILENPNYFYNILLENIICII